MPLVVIMWSPWVSYELLDFVKYVLNLNMSNWETKKMLCFVCIFFSCTISNFTFHISITRHNMYGVHSRKYYCKSSHWLRQKWLSKQIITTVNRLGHVFTGSSVTSPKEVTLTVLFCPNRQKTWSLDRTQCPIQFTHENFCIQLQKSQQVVS